jgi:hypothetical protein
MNKKFSSRVDMTNEIMYLTTAAQGKILVNWNLIEDWKLVKLHINLEKLH